MDNRLAPAEGEWIDRKRPVTFRFEGTAYDGYEGDVLASALWANGVRMMGRSFKYHRPRSAYSMAGHDANVIVESARRTNLRGDLLPVAAGLDVCAVNTKGGLRRDRYKIIERFSRFLPVGFYYKAFHKPRRLFPYFERQMRKAAGLGRLDFNARTALTPKDYDFCELLVIGGGPTGLSAAIAAAEAGVDVLLADEWPHPGGSLCWQRGDQPALRESLLEQARQFPNLRIRTRTMAGGWYPDQWVALFDDQRLTKLRAGATVVATGAIEQPAVFQNNDLPGVMLGSAAQRLLRLYRVKPFKSAVVLTANDDGYGVALDLQEAGCDVRAIVDLRFQPPMEPWARTAQQRNLSVISGSAIYEAIPTSDGERLAAVTVRAVDAPGQFSSAPGRTIECDGLAVCVGWTPNSGLASQAGVRFKYDQAVEQLTPSQTPPGVFVAGRSNGCFALDDRMADGRRAGLAAAEFLGKAVSVPAVPERRVAASHPYPIFAGKKNFVDFDEDIRLVDFVNAHQEGYDSVELMKRYSTYGMGPSQGKLSNFNAVRILARLNDQTIDETGTTTARPFYRPVSIALLAGRRFHPHRETPMDGWHRQAGGVMGHAGAWFRPEYYAIPGRDREEAIYQEVAATRRQAGLIDISTLTKIQVNGADAATLLERVYAGKFANQRVGTLRYALACDESGVLVEDALVARLAEDRFYISASTAGGEPFFREMQRLAILWRLDVTLLNVTGQWGAMNLAGPLSREILQPLTDLSLASDALPHGAVVAGKVCGVNGLILRSAFLGELSFDVHLPASGALNAWKSLIALGKPRGLTPIGTEAQRVLRLEKGHLIAGHDTDALTTPYEANLAPLVKMDKPFFVGKRSLEILSRRPLERLLVGVEFPANMTGPYPEECQLIIQDDQIVGRLTSMARRTFVGPPLGLAFVRPDLAAVGTPLRIQTSPNRFVEAKVAATPFYDPENARQEM